MLLYAADSKRKKAVLRSIKPLRISDRPPSSHRPGQRRVREAPLALLRSRPLQFGRGSGGIHNPTEIRSPECLNLRETGKVVNVLTLSTSRCTASAQLSHVGLLSVALKVIGSRGKT